jgi:hypothetical protein
LKRLERRPRTRCRIPCSVAGDDGRAHEGALVSLSEGGFGIETSLRIEQGEAIRLRLGPRLRAGAARIEGIVWYERPLARAREGAPLRLLGCVVSEATPMFLALLAEVDRRSRPPAPRRPPARPGAVRERAEPGDPELPRSREPLPPPKPEPEERLPQFRVRLKQVGGPRTRMVSLRARSLAEAHELARLEVAASHLGAWEVMEATRESEAPHL